MDEQLADVEFLASSANRVRALDALATEPHDRYELEQGVGISRVTAKRMLDAFCERGWAREEAGRYRTTPLGKAISSEFDSLLSTVETTQRLAPLVDWLPEMDVDPRRFADAEIVHTSPSDSIAPVRRVSERIGVTERVRILSTSVTSEGVAAHRNAVVEKGQSAEVVVSAATLDVAAADPTMATHIREIIEAGGRYYRHEGFEYILFDCDGTALIGLIDETGAPRGAIESEDEAVCEWVRKTFEAHRAEAEPIDPAWLVTGSDAGCGPQSSSIDSR